MVNYIIVDEHNLIHRTKHVGGQKDPYIQAGFSMNIIFNSIKFMWNKFHGDHVVICSDHTSWRSYVYPEYKANRKIKQNLKSEKDRVYDDTFFQAINELQSFFKNETNMTYLHEKGIEADDFIARWIHNHPNDNHYILGSDSDFYQLLYDNVTIYDGLKSHIITNKSVTDDKGNPVFTNKTKVKKGQKIKVSEKILPPDPEYTLFKKIIRGDTSDNIFTSYPGVREKGSEKKPGILEAFNDRKTQGYSWVNFMSQEWEKMKRDGDNIIKERVKVMDQYNFNKILIDLTCQPEEIKQFIDDTIKEQIKTDIIPHTGIKLSKFCKSNDLERILTNIRDYTEFLSKPYPGMQTVMS